MGKSSSQEGLYSGLLELLLWAFIVPLSSGCRRERENKYLTGHLPAWNDLRIWSPPLADFHVPVVGKERPPAGGQVRVNLTFICGGPDYCTDVILSPYDSHADPLVCDSPVPPGGWIPCYLVDFGLGSVILFGQWKHMSRGLQCALLGLSALPPATRVAYPTFPGCFWSQNEWCVDGPGPNLQLKAVIQHTWTPVSKK